MSVPVITGNLCAPRGRPLGTQASGLREKAWRLMRIKGKFTLEVLLETLADGTERDAKSNLLKYITRLESCGVLVRAKNRLPGEALTSPGYVVWVLARDLGRLAPVCRKHGGVLWDPNSRKELAGKAVEVAPELHGTEVVND